MIRTLHNTKRGVAAGIVVAVAAALPMTAAARDLVLDTGASVTVDDSFTCEPSAGITVHADSPDVFQSGSARMQRLVDVAQAILRYECPSLDSLHVTGRLPGVESPVYDGVANAVDDWLVTARRSVSGEDVASGTPGRAPTPEPGARSISVASVKLDMGVDEVRQRIDDVFGVEPSYEPQNGTMSLDRTGCPADPAAPRAGEAYEKPGANCVTAWFTDRRQATLYRFRYTQSADGSVDDVRRVLVENFGEPRADDWNDAGGYRSMLWIAPPDAQAPSELLEARLFRDAGATIIDIVLVDPRLAGDDYPVLSGDDPSRLNLKL